ncbi:hypothetical protein EST92_19740 [Streptomyces sp. TM32]|uniref:hypothetical protein n=1 Tax=Streptomyces sp. TM32 TaxID=1652669 RepID=UPI001010B895|nr:hypothetical protein [Streptomyces sp. TM32]RXS78867.1 hypothetical protein EST92_19740 [Streptomyces sp. TM32]
MTTNELASRPSGASVVIDLTLLERLVNAVEKVGSLNQPADDLRAYTPAEAAGLLGKTENWVTEAIQARRIPFTYVGRSPRLTAAHIRWVLENGEVQPNQFSRKRAAIAA